MKTIVSELLHLWFHVRGYGCIWDRNSASNFPDELVPWYDVPTRLGIWFLED